MTDALQPLDRTVFGALKTHASRLFHLRVRDNPMLQHTKQDAAQDMVSACYLLSPTALVTGWEIYEGEFWEDDLQLLQMIEENMFTEVHRTALIALGSPFNEHHLIVRLDFSLFPVACCVRACLPPVPCSLSVSGEDCVRAQMRMTIFAKHKTGPFISAKDADGSSIITFCSGELHFGA
jgi:hypothetical protein